MLIRLSVLLLPLLTLTLVWPPILLRATPDIPSQPTLDTLNTWQQNGPEGGSVWEIAVQPDSSQIVLATTRGGSIFRSTDGGVSWGKTHVSAVSNYSHIRFNPQQPAIVYAVGSPLLKSVDGGVTWTELDAAPSGAEDITIAAGDPNTMYLCLTGFDDPQRKIYKSSDAGDSWSEIATLPEPACRGIVVSPDDSQLVYAAMREHVYKSSDGGATWVASLDNLPPNAVITSLAMSPISDQILYAGVGGSNPSNHGVYRTEDAGQSWVKLSTHGPYRFVIDSSNPQILYSNQSYDLYKSSDGGVTWVQLQNGLPNSTVFDIAVDPTTSTRVFAATYNGVYVSSNGGASWQARNTGLTGAYIESLAVDPYEPQVIFAGTGGGIYRTLDGGATWSLYRGNFSLDRDIYSLAIDASNTNLIYAGTFGQIFRSTDRGISWQQINTALNSGLQREYIRDLIIDPLNPSNLYAKAYGNQTGIYRSEDSGRTWKVISEPIMDLVGPSYDWFDATLMIDPQHPATFYFAIGARLFKTEDRGINWIELSDGLPDFSWISSIAIDPINSSHLFGCIHGQVYRSLDSAVSWQAVSDIIGCQTLLIDPSNNETIYAGTAVGLYRSTDGGNLWIPFTSGTEVPAVTSLAVVPTSPIWIVAGTRGNGIFSLRFSLAGISIEPLRNISTDAPFTAKVRVLRLNGAVATEYTGPVTLALQDHSAGAVLNGVTTTQAINGVAVFSNLTIDRAGVGYQLAATAGTLTSGLSAPFQVFSSGAGTSLERESNDNLETATPLVFAADGSLELSGHISSVQDIDLYRFTVLPGATLEVALNQLPADYNILLLSDPLADSTSGDDTNVGNVSDIGRWSIGQWSIGRWSIGRWSIGRWSIGRWSIGRWSIALSANDKNNSEQIRETLPRGGMYYLVVFGNNGAFSSSQPYTLAATLQDGTLQQPVLNAQYGRGIKGRRDDTIKTLFVTNSRRIMQRYPADTTARNRLTALLQDPGLLAASQGVILDISSGQDPEADDRLEALYGQWDANPAQPLLANEVAQQINFVIDRAITLHYPAVEYIVLVGGDTIIPFYRLPDNTDLGNERDYGQILSQTASLRDDTPLYGSLTFSFYQTDDFYADRKPTPWRGRQLFIPDQAIGRLVETPTDIVHYLETYVSTLNAAPYTIDLQGTPAPGAAFVTGYDFLSDQAAQIGATLNQFGFTEAGTPGLTMLTEPGWDSDQFESIWFGGDLNAFTGAYSGIASPFGLSSINSHFTHNSAIPAQLDGRPFLAQRLYEPTSANPATAYFKRNGQPTLLYSVGCHSGLSAADDAFNDPFYSADFAQAVLKHGGNWIGNTGYGIGDTDIIAYSERLSLLFTRNIGREILQNDSYIGASIGESLALAKRQYLQTSGPNGFGLFDEKILNEWTLYGLPFIRIKVPNPQPIAELLPPPIPVTLIPTLPAAEGIFTRIITVTNQFAPLLESSSVPLLESVQVIDSFTETPQELVITTATGESQVVLPAFIYDLTLAENSGTAGIGNPEVRGVRLRSASMLPDLPNFDPHVTTPITDQISLTPPSGNDLERIETWQPALPYTFQRTSTVIPGGRELVGGRQGDVTDKLIVIPAQLQPTSAETGTLRRFSMMVFEISYIDPRTASAAVLNTTDYPVFERITVLPEPGLLDPRILRLEVHMVSALEAIRTASVTYQSDAQTWQRVPLTAVDNATYQGQLKPSTLAGAAAFVEVIDKAGNVSIMPINSLRTSLLYLPLIERN